MATLIATMSLKRQAATNSDDGSINNSDNCDGNNSDDDDSKNILASTISN